MLIVVIMLCVGRLPFASVVDAVPQLLKEDLTRTSLILGALSPVLALPQRSLNSDRTLATLHPAIEYVAIGVGQSKAIRAGWEVSFEAGLPAAMFALQSRKANIKGFHFGPTAT
jgi:hypothetical protein